MELENKINSLSSMKIDSEREKMAFLLSSLAPMEMLWKLMTRKNSGKKPFSTEFDYEEKISFLQDTLTYLEGKAKENQFSDPLIKEKILKVASISHQAAEQIKMPSLKNDFLWIEERLALDAKML